MNQNENITGIEPQAVIDNETKTTNGPTSVPAETHQLPLVTADVTSSTDNDQAQEVDDSVAKYERHQINQLMPGMSSQGLWQVKREHQPKRIEDAHPSLREGNTRWVAPLSGVQGVRYNAEIRTLQRHHARGRLLVPQHCPSPHGKKSIGGTGGDIYAIAGKGSKSEAVGRIEAKPPPSVAKKP